MISVVTITYNNPSELKDTLTSLKDVKNCESIVINGGNSPESHQYLVHHFGRVVNEPDEGISDAFNKGIRNSNGDAIVFLNSGDLLIDPSYYAWADRLFSENEKVSFTFSDLFFQDEIAGKILMKPHNEGNASLGAGMPFPHPTLIVRKSIFDEIGGFSKEFKIAMDFDFSVRLLKSGHRGVYYPHATVQMDGGGISSSREWTGILECKRSLIENGLFQGMNRRHYQLRVLRYQIRKALTDWGGKSLVRFIKTLKTKP